MKNEYTQDRNIRYSCYASGIWTLVNLALVATDMPKPLIGISLLLSTIPYTCMMLSVLGVIELRHRKRIMDEVCMPITKRETDYERSYRQAYGPGTLVQTYVKGDFGFQWAGIRHATKQEEEFYHGA
jgi:hypothetical protein